MPCRIYHLHALSALHAGTGQGAGAIDLPIAREKATGLPLVPGSSLKGVLRDELKGAADEKPHQALFGPPTDQAGEHAGALMLGDARLLCLPVRSLAGTFAWATCPLVLRRYRRDLEAAGLPAPQAMPQPADGAVAVCTGSVLEHDNRQVFLEDLDLAPDAAGQDGADAWAEWIAAQAFPDEKDDWRGLFRQRFAVLADAEFDFLAETATEITTRICMDEGTRTVKKGGLWFEESLPAESLLWGVVGAERSRYREVDLAGDVLLALLPGEARLQIGGKASIGRGQARWLMAGGARHAQP